MAASGMPETRDEGASLQAPAAAAKEEQLAQHDEEEHISPNGLAVPPVRSPAPRGGEPKIARIATLRVVGLRDAHCAIGSRGHRRRAGLP